MNSTRIVVLLFAIVVCPKPSLADFERFVSYNIGGYVTASNLTGPATTLTFGGMDHEFSTEFEDSVFFNVPPLPPFRNSITGTGGGFADGYVGIEVSSTYHESLYAEERFPIVKGKITSGLTATATGQCERCGAIAGLYGGGSSAGGVTAGWRDTITIGVPGLVLGIPLHVEGELRFTGETKAEVTGPTSTYCGGGCAYAYAEAWFVSLPSRVPLAYSRAQSADNYRDYPGHFPNIDPTPVISINMDLIIGQPFSFETYLHMNIDGRAAAGRTAYMEADFSHTLAWGGITRVTNALTGEVLSDWTITSDSGFDYSHGVPEPAGALLLIVGYGSSPLLLQPRRWPRMRPTGKRKEHTSLTLATKNCHVRHSLTCAAAVPRSAL